MDINELPLLTALVAIELDKRYAANEPAELTRTLEFSSILADRTNGALT